MHQNCTNKVLSHNFREEQSALHWPHILLHQWVTVAMQSAVYPQWEQCRVHCLAQGDVNLWPIGAEIWTANPSFINLQPALPPVWVMTHFARSHQVGHGCTQGHHTAYCGCNWRLSKFLSSRQSLQSFCEEGFFFLFRAFTLDLVKFFQPEGQQKCKLFKTEKLCRRWRGNLEVIQANYTSYQWHKFYLARKHRANCKNKQLPHSQIE